MRRALSLLALVLALPPCARAVEVPAGIEWTTSFGAALAKASESHKPLMVEFWAEWCGWCHVLERTTFADANVVRLARDFVAVRIDTEGPSDQAQVAARYGITGLPTMLFLAPSGRIVLQLPGYQRPEVFARTLESVREQAVKVATWERAIAVHPDDAEALLHLGLQAYDAEALDESLELLRRAYRADAKLPLADRKHLRLVLGSVLGIESEYAKSATLLKEGLALAPADRDNDSQMLLTLGRVYAAWGKHDDAVATLKRLVQEFPSDPASETARKMLAYLAAEQRTTSPVD
jgi:thioredoxin-related protein